MIIVYNVKIVFKGFLWNYQPYFFDRLFGRLLSVPNFQSISKQKSCNSCKKKLAFCGVHVLIRLIQCSLIFSIYCLHCIANGGALWRGNRFHSSPWLGNIIHSIVLQLQQPRLVDQIKQNGLVPHFFYVLATSSAILE